jgi:GT2 family glycosyltransferase
VKETLPTVLVAAEKSPPVEIVLLDYGSTDGLETWVRKNAPQVKCIRYEAKYFHMAHSRNLSIVMALGDYVVSSDAETKVDERLFEELRKAIHETGKSLIRLGRRPSSSRLAKESSFGGPCDGGCRWWTHGVFCVKRSDFIEAGGFDERFEFYGPEDKDLIHRLRRRGLEYATVNNHKLILHLLTPDDEKAKNYRLPLSKGQMRKRMGKIYDQNEALGKTTANEDGWGRM